MIEDIWILENGLFYGWFRMENPMVIMVGKTQNRWFLMEHPMNMDDDWPTGGTPISQNPHIKNMLRKYRMEKTSDTEPS